MGRTHAEAIEVKPGPEDTGHVRWTYRHRQRDQEMGLCSLDLWTSRDSRMSTCIAADKRAAITQQVDWPGEGGSRGEFGYKSTC